MAVCKHLMLGWWHSEVASKSIQTTVSRNRSVFSVNPLACCVFIDVSKRLCSCLVHWFILFRELYGSVQKFGVGLVAQ